MIVKSSVIRITIATFYKKAQEAGVDLTALARQFTSKPHIPQIPHIPHRSEENYKNKGNEQSKHIQHTDNQNNRYYYSYNSATRANFSDSGEECEECEELRISFCKTFSQLIDKDSLPVTIQRTLEGKETAEEQDKIILAVLNFRIVVKELRENVKHAERERQTR